MSSLLGDSPCPPRNWPTFRAAATLVAYGRLDEYNADKTRANSRMDAMLKEAGTREVALLISRVTRLEAWRRRMTTAAATLLGLVVAILLMGQATSPSGAAAKAMRSNSVTLVDADGRLRAALTLERGGGQ